jgi:hypothetical protein
MASPKRVTSWPRKKNSTFFARRLERDGSPLRNPIYLKLLPAQPLEMPSGDSERVTDGRSRRRFFDHRSLIFFYVRKGRWSGVVA